MALTTTQVNQAFLGLLGRPATGAEAAKFAGQLDAATLAQTLLTDASFKNELSVETLSFKTVDLLNTDPAAFVESLYTALLGRASDAEGKAFWLSVAGATPNRADVVSQFIAAVQSQEGTADANAFATIQAEDKALANAWVESLYNNLAGRASDAEGLDFWTNAIVSFTMTPAQVAASFAATLALQGNTTEDGQNYLAKLGVADNFTASFKDFNALITANEKAEQLKNLVTMMNGVNKDSQVDQYTQEITKITDEYQKIAAVQFTAADDDNLGIDPETGESNLKGAANFTGTYNLTDAAKGTIQSSDSATGTEAYLTDTLTINVTGYDKTTHDTFNLSELPSTTSIEKLSINNGAATVSGSISGDFEYINVNGTGSFNIDATTSNADGFKDIVLNSAANKDGSNSFATAQNAVSIKAGAGNDNIDLRIDATTAATIAKSLSTGAGKDNVVANIGKDATADLGAGDDTFSGFLGQAAKLNAGAGDDVLAVWGAGARLDSKNNKVAEVEIDGGTGTDTLDLTRGLIDGILGQQNTDYLGVKSIKGIEKMIVGNGTTLYASAISGQKIELSGAAGSNLVLNASGASTIDLTKLSNAKDEDVAVRITNVKNGSISLETGNKNFNAIKETIELSSEATKVSVKGFEKGNDHVAIENATATAEELFTHSITGTTTGINTNLVNANEIFFVSLKEKITKNDLNKLLNTATFSNLKEKDVFYVVATDSAEVTGGTGKNSTAKIYKIEVGKDLKVGKLDQMATVNVADKAQLSAQDFGAGTPTPVPSETVDTKDYPVTSGELDLSTVVMSDPNKSYAVELGTNPDVASITSVKLPAGVKAAALVIENKGTTPSQAVEVSVPADAVIPTLTLGSATDNTQYNVTVAAGAKISEIVTNNADNNIDISAVAPENAPTIIDAGQGIDTLVIANNAAANLTTMKNIENLQYSGTKLNADAIMTNVESGIANLTVENTSGEDGKALEIVAGANTQIDLSSLVQKTGATNKAALDITGFKTSTGSTQAQSVKLTNTTAESSFVETVKLGDATGITVTNIGTGDKLSAKTFGAAVEGAFANGTTLTDKKAFYTTAADAAKAEETVKTATENFTTGNAILAVNVGNEAYIYAVTGATEKKGTYSLVAIVDNNIDDEDTVTKAAAGTNPTDTTITFTAPGVTTNVFDYDLNVKTLDLANGKYGQGTKAPTFTSPIAKGDSIAINNVNGDITITDSGAGEKASQGTVKLFALNGTTLNSNSTYNKIDVYLGGYYDETAGKIVADDTITLTANNNFGTKAANVYYNAKELKGAWKDFGTDKIDLLGNDVAANVTITDAITTANSTKNVSTLFKTNSVGSNDTITFGVAASTDDVGKVVATVGKDIITLASNVTNTNALAIDLGDDTAADKLDASAVAAATSGALPTKMLSVINAKAGDQIKLEATASAAVEGVVKTTFDSGSSKSYVDAIKAAFTEGNKGKAFLIEAKDTKASSPEKTKYYLAVDNGTTGLATGDKIIELVGVTDTLKLNTTITDNFITLA